VPRMVLGWICMVEVPSVDDGLPEWPGQAGGPGSRQTSFQPCLPALARRLPWRARHWRKHIGKNSP
jgi:hypothetical protein